MTSHMHTPARRGIALVLVLFVTAVLVILVLEFAHSMQVYATLSANGRDIMDLRAAAQGGVAVAQRQLLTDLLSDVDNDIETDHLEEGWAEPIPEFTLNNVTVTVVITDDTGKFPLASLVDYLYEDGEIIDSTVNVERRRQLAALFDELDIDPDLVDVLVDWMDVDDVAEPGGAEDDAYAQIGRTCRNGRLATIDELELLLGFTPEMVWGDPDDPDVIGLAAVCAVAGHEDGLVNANTAPEVVLDVLLPDRDLADRILSERRREPFVDMADLHDRVGQSGLDDRLTTAGRTWSVDVSAVTAHEVRPLSLLTRVVLLREIDTGEDEAVALVDLNDDANQPTGQERVFSAVMAGAATEPRAVIRVVHWREVR